MPCYVGGRPPLHLNIQKVHAVHGCDYAAFYLKKNLVFWLKDKKIS
jgi:hypothetical protein